jgi:hypothetical protein
MGFFSGISGFSGGNYDEREAQRVMMQRMGRSSGAQAGSTRVPRTVGRSSGARAASGGRGGRALLSVMKAFKSMGPMG